MQVVDPFQAGNEMLFENSKRVMSSVVPLFVAEGRRIALNGSGIYVCIEDRPFLFTAAHIVDASRALITALEPDHVGSLPAKGYYFYRDWADIAITELSETLTQFEPLRATDVQDYGRMPKRMPLCAIGFPASKTKIYSSIADCTTSVAISQEEDEEHYSRVGADPERQIVVTYSKTSMRHLSGQISAAPDVYGMSGGGLFWIHDAGRLGPAIPKLVGILTRWDEVSLTTIVATKTTVLNALLKESHGLRLF